METLKSVIFESRISFVSLLLTEVALCSVRVFTTAPWDKWVLFYVFHCGSFVWICILLIVSLPPTQVDLFHFSIQVPLTRVDPRGLRCSYSAHFNGSVSFYVSQRCSLRWLCLLLGVPLLIPGVDPSGIRCPMLISWLFFCCFTYFTVAHWGSFAIVSDVPLLLTELTLSHSTCSTATHFCGSVLSQVSHILSLGGWFHIIWYVPLMLTGVVLCCPRCPAAAYFCGFVPHRCSTVTCMVALHCPRFPVTLT